jgi:hypothetical protein
MQVIGAEQQSVHQPIPSSTDTRHARQEQPAEQKFLPERASADRESPGRARAERCCAESTAASFHELTLTSASVTSIADWMPQPLLLDVEDPMHRVQSRTYVGQPGEPVAVTTTVSGGGQVRVTAGGQPVVGGQFQLPTAPGATTRMQIALVGPQGAACLVKIAVVDGGSDSDFLLCTTFNPAPVNFYDFSVAATAALTSFAQAKGVPMATAARMIQPKAKGARGTKKAKNANRVKKARTVGRGK